MAALLTRSSHRCFFPRTICYGTGGRFSSSSASIGSNDEKEPSEQLLTSLDEGNGVLTLTLNRPKQRNALTSSLLDSMLEILQEVSSSNNGDVRSVILQSEGGVFSSGHDLKELRSMDSTGHAELFLKSSEVMQLFQNIPQPTISAVQGLATAAGCQLACSTDIVIASPRSSFSTPGIKLGLFCHTPGVEIVRCVGQKLALDMLLTGRILTSEDALKFGLISRIAGNPQKEAKILAVELATQRSPTAIALGKTIFYEQSQLATKNEAYKVASNAMVENLQFDDATDGIDAFFKNNKGKKSPSGDDRPKYTQWQEFGRQENI